MKEYIAKRLDKIKDVNSKVILRDALETIFCELYDETERKYDALRERVLEELPPDLDQFCIYSGLLEKAQLDGSHRYLFPMLTEDLEPLPALETSLDTRFATVFLEADALSCKELSESGVLWRGTIETSAGSVRARFRLELSKRYTVCVQQLYELFGRHNIPWITVNSPYLFKMFDVYIADMELPQGDDGKQKCVAKSFHIECGKYEKQINYDLCPVWNVQKRTIKGEDFPMPALDKVNYEYKFDLIEEGAEHGYLAHGDEVIGARREKDSFIVTSPREKGLRWELFKIWQRKDSFADQNGFEVVSNMQKDSFAGRVMARYGAVIKTKAELIRLLHSFEAASRLTFISYQILWGEVSGETYEVNRFILDEVRDSACTKTMLLRFGAVKRGDILARDIMSFLVSQVQLVYPEYNCVGVLV